MAAPPSKTLKDFNGQWSLVSPQTTPSVGAPNPAHQAAQNKSLSDSVEPVLALQGVGFLTRKAVAMASITLDVKCYEGAASPPSESKDPVTHIEIVQTASKLSSTTEHRCLDFVFREHSDWLFGNVKGRSRWIHAAEVDDAFLAKGWEEGDAEAVGPDGETHLLSHAVSLDRDWTVKQIWGFQVVDGARRYARNIVATTETGDRAEIRLLYDYVS